MTLQEFESRCNLINAMHINDQIKAQLIGKLIDREFKEEEK